MDRIVLDDQQARVVAGTTRRVELVDLNGKHLGYVTHDFTPEDIAEAKRRLASDERRYTAEQVLEHLRSLEKA